MARALESRRISSEESENEQVVRPNDLPFFCLVVCLLAVLAVVAIQSRPKPAQKDEGAKQGAAAQAGAVK